MVFKNTDSWGSVLSWLVLKQIKIHEKTKSKHTGNSFLAPKRLNISSFGKFTTVNDVFLHMYV